MSRTYCPLTAGICSFMLGNVCCVSGHVFTVHSIGRTLPIACMPRVWCTSTDLAAEPGLVYRRDRCPKQPKPRVQVCRRKDTRLCLLLHETQSETALRAMHKFFSDPNLCEDLKNKKSFHVPFHVFTFDVTNYPSTLYGRAQRS